MTLVADAGSTKTDWLLIGPDGITEHIQTAGINPVRDSIAQITSTLNGELLSGLSSYPSPTRIYFYGAGCIDPFRHSVLEALTAIWPCATINVESDLLGAARALCGNRPGIACILGTGSNSCYYDGVSIVQNISPLGYILGDEGSGAVLGRTLVADVLKRQLPEHLCNEFLSSHQLTQADIIQRVYREPQPNRFLASLVPFIEEHRHEESIHALLIHAFDAFFRRNVLMYGHPQLPVHFVGSIAHIYEPELRQAATPLGLTIGTILRQPIHALADFHAPKDASSRGDTRDKSRN